METETTTKKPEKKGILRSKLESIYKNGYAIWECPYCHNKRRLEMDNDEFNCECGRTIKVTILH